MTKTNKENGLGGDEYTHPSYGAILLSKTYGDASCLLADYTSGVYITLTIHEASVRRTLSLSWLFPRKQLIKIRLTPHQFADLITSFNSGTGTPCTIERVGGKQVAFQPLPSEVDLQEVEIHNHLQKAIDNIDELYSIVQSLLNNKKAGVKDLSLVLNQLTTIRQEISKNVNFVLESFKKYTVDLTAKAKIDIHTWVEARSRNLTSIQEQYTKLIEGHRDEDL